MLAAELPLHPGDALRRTPVRLPLVHGSFEVPPGPVGIAAEAFQACQAAIRIQIPLELHHLLIGLLGLLVLAHLQVGVTEDAIGMTIGGV